MSSIMNNSVSTFVALLTEHDIITQEAMGARAAMARAFRVAADDAGVVRKDLREFAAEFSSQVLEEIRAAVKGAEARRVTRTATIRISEAKRIYGALLDGNRDARKVYMGSLSVIGFLKSLSGTRSSKPKLAPKAFAVRVRKLLASVSRKDRAAALAALAVVVRKSRAAR